MLELKNIENKIGDFFLGPVSLKMETGQYYALLGRNGAGKTLLLETISGIQRHESGEIWLDQENITFLPTEKRRIGFLYQEYFLFPHLSVKENILYGLRYKKLSRNEKEEKLQNLTDLLELKNIINRTDVLNLSGGEKQKVALARALIIEPKILLLDEPLHSLDRTLRPEVLKIFKHVNKSLDTSIIHVTHDYDEAAFVADKIAVLSNGKIAQVGPPEEIFQHPKTGEIAKLAGRSVSRVKAAERNEDTLV